MRASILPLAKWIPSVNAKFSEPRHLRPVTDIFQRIARKVPVRECISAPPRMCKTTTLEDGCVWLLAQDPTLRIIWVSYAQRFAERASGRMRALAGRVGVPLARDTKSKGNWRTGIGDGGLWCTSVGGSVTGEGADVIVVDDPVRGRADAESAAEREKLYDFFTDDLYTRLDTPTASVVVNGARWTQDDLIGRLVDGDSWPYHRLPAIDDDGKALWPERFSAQQLHEIREQLGEYAWQSLYMGNPMPKGNALFGDVHFVDELPSTVDALSVGVDLAYSAKSSADYSVAVVMARVGRGKDAKYFVVHVVRLQVLQSVFAKRLASLKEDYPKALFRMYASGIERGATSLLRDLAGVDVGERNVTGDKHQRAQPLSAAWNAGKVFLPRSAPWLDSFVSELKSFTGVRDRHDDQVDAAAAAFDVLVSGDGTPYEHIVRNQGQGADDRDAYWRPGSNDEIWLPGQKF